MQLIVRQRLKSRNVYRGRGCSGRSCFFAALLGGQTSLRAGLDDSDDHGYDLGREGSQLSGVGAFILSYSSVSYGGRRKCVSAVMIVPAMQEAPHDQ